MNHPIRIHPDHPRYFEFRGKPLVLICATEHYGSVLNRRFVFERYLQEHADKKQTLTRLFLLFRELQSHCNPYSPCKPESPDFVAPWPRTGPGKALDGEPQYDLSRWNEEYFERLHRFFSMASELGIVIEATIFSNSYGDHIYALNPLHPANNIQGVGVSSYLRYNTMLDEALWSKQQEFVRKIVGELNRYDNFYFEICNEPGTLAVQEVTAEQVDEWQREIGELIRASEADLPNQHLVFGGQAFTHPPFYQETSNSFANPAFDAVTIHPLPDTSFSGRVYDMGAFMSKQLHLAEFKAFTLAAAAAPKPCVHDEDNIASCYRDSTGWTIHRKRAWTAVMCGAHYDVIDFSIVVHAEAGTEASRRELRSWLKHLSNFIHSMDIPRTKPLGDWLLEKPANTLECTLAVEGEDYAVYLADPREVIDADLGSPISGAIRFAVPPGEYLVTTFSPVDGGTSPGIRISCGQATRLELAPFPHDMAVRIKRL
ncbi:MAG TPA: DUF6298 domain-containing protein [Abditibacteriaceae bacterium]|nr:DUF6298 domain-containing protein [Abditibacteriaceae bacterium]